VHDPRIAGSVRPATEECADFYTFQELFSGDFSAKLVDRVYAVTSAWTERDFVAALGDYGRRARQIAALALFMDQICPSAISDGSKARILSSQNLKSVSTRVLSDAWDFLVAELGPDDLISLAGEDYSGFPKGARMDFGPPGVRLQEAFALSRSDDPLSGMTREEFLDTLIAAIFGGLRHPGCPSLPTTREITRGAFVVASADYIFLGHDLVGNFANCGLAEVGGEWRAIAIDWQCCLGEGSPSCAFREAVEALRGTPRGGRALFDFLLDRALASIPSFRNNERLQAARAFLSAEAKSERAWQVEACGLVLRHLAGMEACDIPLFSLADGLEAFMNSFEGVRQLPAIDAVCRRGAKDIAATARTAICGTVYRLVQRLAVEGEGELRRQFGYTGDDAPSRLRAFGCEACGADLGELAACVCEEKEVHVPLSEDPEATWQFQKTMSIGWAACVLPRLELLVEETWRLAFEAAP
jgi:hypothetical protein